MNIQFKLFVYFIVLLSFQCWNVNAVSCLNSRGESVDWFFLLKMGDKVNGGGFTYAYFDSESNGRYTIGSLEKDDNPVAKTTMQLGLYVDQFDQSNVGYLLYNDQTYEHVDDKRVVSHYKDDHGNIYAHSKGFIGFDDDSSFWMIHSAPGFPYNHTMAPKNWYFPWGQTVFAQHFFCSSFKLDAVQTISEQIQYYYPYVYDHNIPASMKGKFPALQNIIDGKLKSGMTSSSLTTKGGAVMKGFGKSGDSGSDLFEDVIAPGLNTGLKVMTWCGGYFNYGCTDSYCKGKPIVDPSTPQKKESTYQYDVVMMGELYFGSGYQFNVTYNHAKWGIAYSPEVTPEPWFCAADINRETTQRKRGGGTLCLHNSELWSKLNDSVIISFDKSCDKK